MEWDATIGPIEVFKVKTNKFTGFFLVSYIFYLFPFKIASLWSPKFGGYSRKYANLNSHFFFFSFFLSLNVSATAS